jgi:stage V sporulation protein D (sporulation-specific penicillin-binding protein)
VEKRKIEKQKGQIEKVYQWNDKVYTNIPNVVGMDIKNAKKKLTDFEIEYTGNGSKVIEQSPVAYERVAKGSIIRLLLGE